MSGFHAHMLISLAQIPCFLVFSGPIISLTQVETRVVSINLWFVMFENFVPIDEHREVQYQNVLTRRGSVPNFCERSFIVEISLLMIHCQLSRSTHTHSPLCPVVTLNVTTVMIVEKQVSIKSVDLQR